MILDTLSRFWSVRDENDNAEVVREVGPLLDLARDTGAVIVLVHHEGKGGGADGRGIRGASALFALGDQALMLDRRQGGDTSHRVLRALGRYDETPRELIITLDGDAWTALGTTDEIDKEASKAKVEEALTEEPQSREQLAKATGLTQKAVKAALDSLALDVIREGAGKKGDPYTYRSQG